jgi:glc operon protein GlcG
MRNRAALTPADAHRMMSACKAEAKRRNLSVSIAIIDDGGSLLLFERGDGIPPGTAESAIGKARIAVVVQASSRAVRDMIENDPAMMKFEGIPLPGGLPLKYRGDCVGGIGISGATAEDDERIAGAGAAALA